eukprot:Rhum_TRINITY_DN14828_c14_g1::Rhum_TRINITY_DN14828_c14_g1_i1::g.123996::m.123996
MVVCELLLVVAAVSADFKLNHVGATQEYHSGQMLQAKVDNVLYIKHDMHPLTTTGAHPGQPANHQPKINVLNVEDPSRPIWLFSVRVDNDSVSWRFAVSDKRLWVFQNIEIGSTVKQCSIVVFDLPDYSKGVEATSAAVAAAGGLTKAAVASVNYHVLEVTNDGIWDEVFLINLYDIHNFYLLPTREDQKRVYNPALNKTFLYPYEFSITKRHAFKLNESVSRPAMRHDPFMKVECKKEIIMDGSVSRLQILQCYLLMVSDGLSVFTIGPPSKLDRLDFVKKVGWGWSCGFAVDFPVIVDGVGGNDYLYAACGYLGIAVVNLHTIGNQPDDQASMHWNNFSADRITVDTVTTAKYVQPADDPKAPSQLVKRQDTFAFVTYCTEGYINTQNIGAFNLTEVHAFSPALLMDEPVSILDMMIHASQISHAKVTKDVAYDVLFDDLTLYTTFASVSGFSGLDVSRFVLDGVVGPPTDAPPTLWPPDTPSPTNAPPTPPPTPWPDTLTPPTNTPANVTATPAPPQPTPEPMPTPTPEAAEDTPTPASPTPQPPNGPAGVASRTDTLTLSIETEVPDTPTIPVEVKTPQPTQPPPSPMPATSTPSSPTSLPATPDPPTMAPRDGAVAGPPQVVGGVQVWVYLLYSTIIVMAVGAAGVWWWIRRRSRAEAASKETRRGGGRGYDAPDEAAGEKGFLDDLLQNSFEYREMLFKDLDEGPTPNGGGILRYPSEGVRSRAESNATSCPPGSDHSFVTAIHVS